MRVIAVVGTKKTGKTTVVERLVASLKGLGKVGIVKDMEDHLVDSGDTRRHFMAGADDLINEIIDLILEMENFMPDIRDCSGGVP